VGCGRQRQRGIRDSSYTVVESNGSVTVEVERVGDSDVSVEVLLTTVAGTAEGELLYC